MKAKTKQKNRPKGEAALVTVPPAAVRLDLGCGPGKAPGFLGVDKLSFPGVDVVFDLASSKKWPWPDNSVEEARSSHFIEHLTGIERVHFMNELHRVLAPGAKALITTPHWASNRAYGDFTHQWPPVSEFWFYYLKREWRLVNAPHTDSKWNPAGYDCDFDASWGYTLHPQVVTKAQAAQMDMLTFYKEAAQDTVATLTKAMKVP